jgi:hypothetical protein
MTRKAKASPRSSKPVDDEPRVIRNNLGGYLLRALGLDQIEASNPPVATASQAAPKPRLEDDPLTQYDVQMQVLSGDWGPDQAEAWARRRGFPPFAGKPNPASYDASKELGWTPLMSLVWIVYRDMKEVREVLPEYVVAHKEWVPRGQGWGITRVRCEYSFERNLRYVLPPSDAVKELWGKLASGEISALGIRVGEAVRRVIPSEEWYDIKPIDCEKVEGAAYGSLYAFHAGGALRREYGEVKVAVQDVLRAFPDPRSAARNIVEQGVPVANGRTPQRNQTKPQAIAALLERLFPEGRPAMKNPELLKRILAAEPGVGLVSARTFSRAIAIAWPPGSQKGAK